MLQTINFHGTLKTEIAQSLQFDARSIKSAINAINCNFKNFNSLLKKYDFKFIADGVTLSSKDISVNQYNFKTLDIIPVTIGDGGHTGSKRKDIIGGSEIAVGVALTIFTGGTLATIGADLIVAGVGTIAGSILSSFMKPKSYDTAGDSAQSNIFHGARNLSKEGVAIPILYGRMVIGSLVASGYIAVKGQKL